MKTLGKTTLVLVLLFLYVPIFVLIVFSFNESKSHAVFSGFTFSWYRHTSMTRYLTRWAEMKHSSPHAMQVTH